MRLVRITEPPLFSPEDLEVQEAAEREQKMLDEERSIADTVRPLLRRAFGYPRYGSPHFVGSFNIEEFWYSDADAPTLGNMRVTCLDCHRQVAPFRTRSLVSIGGGWRWVGLDYMEPYTDYFFACGWCGRPMLFTMYVPQ